MPNKRTTAPKIAPLSAAGSTAAVIVTHNRVELLRASLEQVVSQTHPVKWVIVVDNGADDAVKQLVDDLAGSRA
ncbi:MAG: glycosyltransferase, partial [Corynebacterium casei]|nr:glycosyltransferase [Corynebacterium casei]